MKDLNINVKNNRTIKKWGLMRINAKNKKNSGKDKLTQMLVPWKTPMRYINLSSPAKGKKGKQRYVSLGMRKQMYLLIRKNKMS